MKRLLILFFIITYILLYFVIYPGKSYTFGDNNSDCHVDIMDLYSITWKKADKLLGKPIEIERSGEMYIRKYKPCQSFKYIELYFHENSVLAVTVILSNSVKSMGTAKQIMGLDNIGPPDQTFPAGARWHYHNKFEISIYDGPPINAFILFISHSQWDDLNR